MKTITFRPGLLTSFSIFFVFLVILVFVMSELVTASNNLPVGHESYPGKFNDNILYSSEAPVVTSIFPNEVYNWKSIRTTIRGANFVDTPIVRLNNAWIENVTQIDSNTITSTVPSDLPSGMYTVTVTNPDGQSGILGNSFMVLRSGDGSLASWKEMFSMINPRVVFGVVEKNGFIYAIGGENSVTGDLSSVESAAINSDGSL